MYLIAFVTVIGLASTYGSAMYRSDNYRSDNYRSDNYRNYGYRNENPTDVCLKVPTLGDFSLETIRKEGAIYRNVVDDTEDNRKVDNVCITVFQSPSNPDIWEYYISAVLCDGSNIVYPTLAADTAPGTIQRADPYNVDVLYVFDETCCDTYLTYICRVFSSGDSLTLTTLSGTSPIYRPLPLSCLEKIKEKAAFYGLNIDVIALPQKLPPRCITQPACVPSIPFYNKRQMYPKL